jgi:ubiquinone/menaquinone biosynthesis C-methylase UbiE
MLTTSLITRKKYREGGSLTRSMVGAIGIGRTAQEAHRLLLQAEVYAPLTHRFFVEAGIREGMRVLDIGSGPGGVAAVLSKLVGRNGSILGIELNPAMVEIARRVARDAHESNLEFVSGDVESINVAGPFDAIVGRFVLRELKDAACALRRLSRLRVPGGIVAFQEKVLAISVRTFPQVSVIQEACGWMDEGRRRSGVEIVTGAKLVSHYLAAGLPAPALRFDAPVAHGPEWPGYAYLVETLRGMLPLMRSMGIVNDEKIEIGTLEDRMRAEATKLGAVLILTPCIGAWTLQAGINPLPGSPDPEEGSGR